jgi:DNA-directed RNA polymerase specialized sigma24 family protein
MEEPMKHAEINRAFDAKVRLGIFAPVVRFLTNSTTAEDRLQDAICQTWAMYHRYATEKGKVLDDGILVHSCRQRAVDLDRHFVPTNGVWRSRQSQDVFDPRAFRDGKAEVRRIDGIDEDGGAEGDRGLHVGYAEALASSPARKIRSAIDLESWIGTLTHRDRYIMEARMAGFTLEQIASDLDVSTSNIFARARELGLELAARAGVRIDLGDAPRGRRRSCGAAQSPKTRPRRNSHKPAINRYAPAPC